MSDITFIIPTVNDRPIGRAVDSLLGQTDEDWECVIIGDGVEPPSFNDSRITTFAGPHVRSASKTRLFAIDYFVSTEWVGFLDDDDIVGRHYVEIFRAEHQDCDTIVFKMMNYGHILPRYGHAFIYGDVGISYATKTELIKKYRFPEPPGEDHAYIHRLMEAQKAIRISEYLGYWVRPNGSYAECKF